MGDLREVLDEVAAERRQQDRKWGRQDHPSFDAIVADGSWLRAGAGSWTVWGTIGEDLESTARLELKDGATWAAILAEEVGEAFQERDEAKLRTELVQVAAVAVAWIEAIDRRALTRREVSRG